MIRVVSWTIAVRILGIHVSVLVEIGSIRSGIRSLGSGVRVEGIGLGIFGVLFTLLVDLSIVMKNIVIGRMIWREKKRHA